jgi:hypothetical protein
MLVPIDAPTLASNPTLDHRRPEQSTVLSSLHPARSRLHAYHQVSMTTWSAPAGIGSLVIVGGRADRYAHLIVLNGHEIVRCVRHFGESWYHSDAGSQPDPRTGRS